MTRTIRAMLAALAVAVTMAGCGGATDFEEAPVTSPSIPATPATPAAPATTAGRNCASILSDGLQLAIDRMRESRGIVEPDTAKYKARAQVLADEARRLGCPVPASVENFLR